ncbi:hypothetical protein ACIGDI_42075 [Streptomyces sp. NPDC085900]|uniref:hypothetical protein n=1 Tax=Streptomyces sp. NPDC085900 TaxID=3365737 RepID=UPI0037D435D0
MVHLSTQVSHGGMVFLLMWGVGALFMGSVLTSRKGSGWLRSTVAAGLLALTKAFDHVTVGLIAR